MLHHIQLPVGPREQFHEFGDLLALLGCIAAGDGVLHAMADVILENGLFNTTQRRAHGRNLRDDIDAIAFLIDHFGDAAYLTFDLAQPLEAHC